jgi:hypothetical protein
MEQLFRAELYLFNLGVAPFDYFGLELRLDGDPSSTVHQKMIHHKENQ